MGIAARTLGLEIFCPPDQKRGGGGQYVLVLPLRCKLSIRVTVVCIPHESSRSFTWYTSLIQSIQSSCSQYFYEGMCKRATAQTLAGNDGWVDLLCQNGDRSRSAVSCAGHKLLAGVVGRPLLAPLLHKDHGPNGSQANQGVHNLKRKQLDEAQNFVAFTLAFPCLAMLYQSAGI